MTSIMLDSFHQVSTLESSPLELALLQEPFVSPHSQLRSQLRLNRHNLPPLNHALSTSISHSWNTYPSVPCLAEHKPTKLPLLLAFEPGRTPASFTIPISTSMLSLRNGSLTTVLEYVEVLVLEHFVFIAYDDFGGEGV